MKKIGTLARLTTLLLLSGALVVSAGCKRMKYETARIDEPTDKPNYTVGIETNHSPATPAPGK